MRFSSPIYARRSYTRALGAGHTLLLHITPPNPDAGFPLSLSVTTQDGCEWNADPWNPMIDPETHQLDPNRPKTVEALLDAIDERVAAAKGGVA